MAHNIYIEKLNEVEAIIYCEDDINAELSDYFKFKSPNAQWSPAYNDDKWDGYIRLYNGFTHKLLVGMIPRVIEFANVRGYTVELNYEPNRIKVDLIEWLKLFPVSDEIKHREYQIKAVQDSLRETRTLTLSPTASGKSFMIYLMAKITNQVHGQKILITAPRTGIVTQLKKDFIEYGCSEEDVATIYEDTDVDGDQKFVISTWQSIYKRPSKWFDRFGTVCGDEVHLYEASCVKRMMKKTKKAEYKFGFTGSLKETKTHKLHLEGLFGKITRTKTTKELQTAGYLSPIEVKAIQLDYIQLDRKRANKLTYQDELKFLIEHEPRTNFIVKCTESTVGNTLVLFERIEHGKVLHERIIKACPNKTVHYIAGEIDKDKREDIRQHIINNPDEENVIVASLGTYSTGINIPNLHVIIFTHPFKSSITLLQSLGRGLRKHITKSGLVLIDIADDLKYKGHVNYAFEHFMERLKIYRSEGHPVKPVSIKLKDFE